MENLVEYRLGSQDGTPTRWSSRAHDGNPSRIRFGHQQPPFRAQFGWGGDSYSEHVQGGDGIIASGSMEIGVRQGDGKPRKARSVPLSVLGFSSLGEEGHRDQTGVRGQGRSHTERTSRGSGLGTSTGSRQRLHLCSGMPYPESSGWHSPLLNTKIRKYSDSMSRHRF